TKSWLWHQRLSHLNFDTINDLAKNEPQVLQTPTATTTTADTAPTPTNSSSQATNFPNTSQDVDELETQQHVQHQPATIADNVPNAMFDENTFVNPFATPSTSDAESSSSQYVDPSNMHTFYQPYPHEFQWTKDHPLEQVIGEPSRPVLTCACEKLVSWSSKKQDCTSLSTAEAEYVSLSACCAQVLWIRTQLTDYGFHFNKIPIYCDLKSAIAISCNPVQHSRTKHIAAAPFHKGTRGMGTIETVFCQTDYQLAEPLPPSSSSKNDST
ncbi:hypothetical protein Tco_0948784, partial [Tanacetum coccineum]